MDATRADIERPGDHHRDRKPEGQQHDDQRDGPVREVDRRHYGGGHFDHHPGGDGIEDDHTDHATATQLGKE